MSPVDVDGSVVLVVTVPRSWRAPHLVRSTKQRWSMAKRNSAGKYTLGAVSELRVAFAESLDGSDRARRWHDDLVGLVGAGQTPVPLDRNRFLVLSFRPLAAGAPGAVPLLDVAATRRSTDGPLSTAVFLHGSTMSWGTRVNFDGVYIAAMGDQMPLGYTQVFRDGTVAYIDDYIMTSDEDSLDANPFAARIVGAFARTPALIEWVGAELPIVVQLTMHGARGLQFVTTRERPSMLMHEPPTIDRDVVALPPLVVDRVPADIDEAAALCRPMLDALWNAGGLPECHLLDDAGAWTGHRQY